MPQSDTVFKVSELAAQMRDLVEKSYPQVWIEGELSSLSAPATGHKYFTLKDESAQLRCAMFKNQAQLSRYTPKAGDLVRIRARISIYTVRGDLQCIVQHIEDAGIGLLQRRYEELKQKLAEEGLFDSDKKLLIPNFPKHLGLVTSTSGAAIKDVLSTLQRRYSGLPITVYPATVQGDTASDSLISALRDAVNHGVCDVLIICRGGGSLEDLWCFNNENLARAIHACPLPIVSGVGHEVDVTIADLVADLRAPTPTAAAEIISPDLEQLNSQLLSFKARVPRLAKSQIEKHSQSVDLLSSKLVHPKQNLQRQSTRLQFMSRSLHQIQSAVLAQHRSNLNSCTPRLKACSPIANIVTARKTVQSQGQRQFRALRVRHDTITQGYRSLSEKLNAVSPLATLGRGFAITRNPKQTIIRSVNQVATGDQLSVQLSDGTIACKVEENPDKLSNA